MTRINHFNLYECPKCRQIHIKPEYSSISLYMGMPPNAYYAPTDLKACQKCGEKSSFSEYIPVGHMEPREFKEKRMDPRSLFPYFSDHPRATPPPDPIEILRRIGDESFYQFGRRLSKSWISSWKDKFFQKLRSLAN